MQNCLFCKIASKEISSEIVYEDDSAVAFLDINPCTPGHTVVIPKAHAGDIIDLKDNSLKSLFLAVKNVVVLLKNKLGREGHTMREDARVNAVGGFTIGINHGTMAGQLIDHLHVHVIPRYEGDGGGSIHSVAHYGTGETVKEMARRIMS